MGLGGRLKPNSPLRLQNAGYRYEAPTWRPYAIAASGVNCWSRFMSDLPENPSTDPTLSRKRRRKRRTVAESKNLPVKRSTALDAPRSRLPGPPLTQRIEEHVAEAAEIVRELDHWIDKASREVGTSWQRSGREAFAERGLELIWRAEDALCSDTHQQWLKKRDHLKARADWDYIANALCELTESFPSSTSKSLETFGEKVCDRVAALEPTHGELESACEKLMDNGGNYVPSIDQVRKAIEKARAQQSANHDAALCLDDDLIAEARYWMEWGPIRFEAEMEWLSRHWAEREKEQRKDKEARERLETRQCVWDAQKGAIDHLYDKEKTRIAKTPMADRDRDWAEIDASREHQARLEQLGERPR
jgi:hypothetical protein